MNESKFTGLGKTYSKYRPSYPKEFIDYLCSDVGICKESVIADVGSGTGILTKQLLDLGCFVFAVEPNNDMRSIAETDLSIYDNFKSVNASAENTTLYDKSIDYITVAQAFHWFNRMEFNKECKRILKPNSKVILVWNSRCIDSDVTKDGDNINRKYCPDFKGFSGGMRGIENDDNSYNDFFKSRYEVRIFQNNIPCDLDGYIGRNRSASYALKEHDKNFHAYIAELTECFNKYAVDGMMNMPNNTHCYVGVV